MKRNKPFAIMMAIIMMLPIFSVAPVTVHAEDAWGARAQFGGEDGTELFLGGKYIELGISNWGDFGTEGDAPEGFRGTDGDSRLGMSADHDGYGVGKDLPVDYYLPGTPEERFAVGYEVDGVPSVNSNSAVMDGRSGKVTKNMPTTIVNNSELDKGLLKATIVSTWKDTMEITQVISFNEDDKFYRNNVTIKNLTDKTWDGARYMRTLDPDNTQFQGGSFDTANTVTHTYAEDGKAVVKAEAYSDSDPLYQSFGSRAPFFFYSSNPTAVASVFGFSNDNAYDSKAYVSPQAKGVTIKADTGITMTWDSGTLAPGETSQTFTYYTSLDERDFSEVEAEIELDEGGSTGVVETEVNDGTVTGNQKVVVKGANLAETIDKNHTWVNNLPKGLDFTVTRLSDTELDFQFTGAAVQHSKEFTLDNASVTVGKENLIGSSSDLSTSTFPITFYDPAMIHVNEGVVTEDVYGTGQLTDSLTLTLVNGKFAEDITNADVVVNNLPAGLSSTVTRNSDSELQINLSGTATVTDDVYNASTTVLAGHIIGSPGPLTSNTFKIDFKQAEPYLVVQTPVVYESDANDGSIADPLTFKLINGTFDVIVSDAVYLANLPAGLSIGDLTKDSDTQVTLAISGSAVNHDAADSVNEVSLGIAGVKSNTFAIGFRSPPPAIVVSPDVIEDQDDGSISDKLSVTLKNGTFNTDITGGVKVNNLPEGVGISVTRISDTVIEISFTGTATKKNEASEFASVTVDPSIVNGATTPLTSNNFNLNTPEDTTLAHLDHTALTWDTIKEDNIVPESVTSDVYLPTIGTYGSSMTWTSTNPSIIATDGTVTRPAYESGDMEVTLTATITTGSATETKQFVLNVKKLIATDEQAIAEAVKEITWDNIKEDNEAQDAVMTELDLVTLGGYGTTITWTSSDDTIIGTDGTVVRPSYTEGDQNVMLTATITKGDKIESKQFDLTVTATPIDVNPQLDEAIQLLRIGYAEQDSEDSVTENVQLISEGFYDSVVTWTSHRSDIVSDAGEVQRPLKDTIVRLTARVTKEGFFREKHFYITVKGTSLVDIPQDELDVGIVYAPGDTEDSVTKNLFLTTIGQTGSNITWTSNRVDIISDKGRVNRPGPDEEDVIVVLTAELTDPDNPAAFSMKTFTLTVKKLSDQEAVDEAARSLGIEEAATFVAGDIWESVTEEFLLLETGKYSTDITWTSNQPSVIDIERDDIETTGIVSRQDEETKVILTATFSRNGKTSSKQYLLVVKGIGVSKDGAIRQPTARQAELSVNNDGSPLQQGVTILRTEMSDGVNIDTIIVDDNDMYNLVESINPNDPDVVNRSVVITHVDDPAENADEIAIEIPATAVNTLAGRNTSLDIVTDLATIHLDEVSIRQLEAAGTDLYFRIVPVREVLEQQTFQSNVVTNGSRLLSLASNKTVKVLGMPREIETNYSGVNTNIQIPLSELSDQIPVQSSGDRDAFLDNIRIYVEHSDGENVVYSPLEIVYTAEGEPDSVAFQIDKFSTFQMIQITDKVSSGSRSGPMIITEPLDDGGTTLTGKKLKELQEEDGHIIVETDFGTLKLDAGSMDLDEIRKQFDKDDINPNGIEIHVGITDADPNYIEEFRLAAEQRQVQPVGQPIHFNIEATYEGQTSPVTLRGWVEYTLPVPEGMKITTGVLYKDGEIYHQPTYVTIEDGRYYATINSLENGVFGLIWNPKEFPDVENHWSRQDVNDMGSRLVASGKSDEVFDAQRPITRSEFTALIVRALGIVKHDAQSVEFSDVLPHSWFEQTMNIAIEHGVIFGYPDGTFKPDNSITRQEAMAIISRAMVITDLMVSSNEEQYLQLLRSFKDSASIAQWATEDVKMNLTAGIIVGRNERLSPDENITRAEAAAAIRRLLIQSELINP